MSGSIFHYLQMPKVFSLGETFITMTGYGGISCRSCESCSCYRPQILYLKARFRRCQRHLEEKQFLCGVTIFEDFTTIAWAL